MLLGERDRGKEICDVHGASAANASSQQTRVSLSFKTMDGIFCRCRHALRAHLGVLSRKIEPRSVWLVLVFRKLISQTRAAARLGKRCGVFRKLISRLNNILNKKRATGRGMGRLPATWEVMDAEMYAVFRALLRVYLETRSEEGAEAERAKRILISCPTARAPSRR